MQKIDRTRRKRRYLALSFAVPFGVMLLCFVLGGLWPFGDRQVLAHDMWHQYYPFFVSFREKLRSGGSLQYLSEAGMGIGYLPLYAYYLSSPLYLLSVLVPASLLREFFALLVLTKIGLAGLFFAVFLRTAFRRNEPALVPFSMMYALCSFVAGYYWNIIWLDALALLPLMLAGMVSLLREGRFRLYTLALALSLLCNYYLSFFCCIFVGLSFFVWCICRWDGWKRFFRRFCRIALCTLLGVGMAAVLLLPTLYGLQNTHSAGNEAPELLALNIAEDASGKAAEGQSTLDLLKEQTLPGLAYGARRVLANLLTSTEPTKMEGLPNVYCGFAAVALAVFFLCCKKVRLREKLLSVGLLAFFLLSFLFRTLDYYWHGGHFPNMLPYRFSFLFSFVLIVMAYRAWTLLDCFRKRYLFVILPVCCIARSAGGSSSAWRCCLPSSGQKWSAASPWAWQRSRSRPAHPIRASLRMCRPSCRPYPRAAAAWRSRPTRRSTTPRSTATVVFPSSPRRQTSASTASAVRSVWPRGPRATATSIMRAARSRI